MILNRGSKSSQAASGHGINVGHGVAGGLNVDKSVNSTVVNLYEALSKDGLSLDERTLEYFLRREVAGAIRPYANALNDAYAQVDSLVSEAEERDNALGELSRQNSYLNHEVGRRKTSRYVVAAAGILILMVGIVAGALIRSPSPGSRISDPPVASEQRSPSAATAAQLAPNPRDAEALIRHYFVLGDQHQAEAMWGLTSTRFQEDSAGYESLAYWWTDGFVDIDALISPGKSPLVDPSDSTVIWVQVAWRHKSKADADIRAVDFDVQWFPVVMKSGQYWLDAVGKVGSAKHCRPREVVSCAQSDFFNP